MHQLPWKGSFLAPDIECERLKLRTGCEGKRLRQANSQGGPNRKLMVIGLAYLRDDQRVKRVKLLLIHGLLALRGTTRGCSSSFASSSGGAFTSCPVLTLCRSPTWPSSACSTAPSLTSLPR